MHRSNLLELLASYSRRHPEEAQTCARFMQIVSDHERCFERDCWAGHVTGSAWLVDPGQQALLLTHHRKLDMWLQLGGHSDGDSDTQGVAVREASEESGLGVTVLDADIFDIDIHPIPARKSDPEHLHFDVRFALQADSANFTVSGESLDLAWAPIEQLETYTKEHSILRMRDKWLARRTG